MHLSYRFLASLCALVLFQTLAPCAVAAAADDFPAHPVRLVTAFNGGISDTVAHTFGKSLGQSLDKGVIVTARSGGAGNIGVETVANAAPDGYTLLLGGGWLYTNRLLQPTPYNDPDRSLTAIAPIVSVPYVWVASSNCGCRDLNELVRRIDTAARPLSYGSPGIGTPPHLLIEQFVRSARRPAVHVPYRGGGPLIVAALSGEVNFSLISLPTALPYVKRGDLRALAVTSAKRSPLLPDVPTVREQGFADQEVGTWFGLFAPAGLAPSVRARLVRATRRAAAAARLRDAFSALGAITATDADIDGFPRLLDEERQRWKALAASLPRTGR